MSKRIFLAVDIHPEPEMLELIDRVKDGLFTEYIKWVDENQFHITLKFFGDTDDKMIIKITEAARQVCNQKPPFSFEVTNPWYFRDRDQLRVVLMNTSRIEALFALQQQIEKATIVLGIPKENRVFKPHLTLGRIKSIRETRAFYELMKSFQPKTIQTVQVRELILYESILKPTGPEYIQVEKFRLQSGL